MTTDVPPDADPATCPYCGRPFPDEEILTLHEGLAHPSDLSDVEREAVARARETEANDVRTFRLQALGLLVLLYFGFLFAYALFA